MAHLQTYQEMTPPRGSSFLTLTYRDEDLPDDWSVDVRDFQLFAKRLRNRLGPFDYFHCGEYGKLLRPHYHALIFGHDFSRERKFFKTIKGNRYFTSDILSEDWNLGFVVISDVTYESAAYVASYTYKKITGKGARNADVRVDEGIGAMWQVKPPYATMSKGIGADWIRKYKRDVYPADEVVMSGRRFRPPRFFDELVLSEEELADIKASRAKRSEKYQEEQSEKRLKAREKVEISKRMNFNREI